MNSCAITKPMRVASDASSYRSSAKGGTSSPGRTIEHAEDEVSSR